MASVEYIYLSSGVIIISLCQLLYYYYNKTPVSEFNVTQYFLMYNDTYNILLPNKMLSIFNDLNIIRTCFK